MTNLVIIKNEQAVTSSLQVAESFEKQHKDVLKAIDSLDFGSEDLRHQMFHEDTYENRGKSYRKILMNRDGFTLLAMGFNGKKAMQFKLRYIEAFNQMERNIKQQLDMAQLSPELQMVNGLFKALANQELATKQLETKIEDMKEILSINSNEWRNKANRILKRIANNIGGTEPYRSVVNMSYERFETKAHCDLNRRLENRKTKMAAKGMSKTAIQKLNKLDCISEDQRLIEIYLSVVKQMAIQFGIKTNDLEQLKVV
ncbi:Rha family transcriptional regulator [Listeria booriae]|uniref:Rha family transcriptional regulator n=1 Tax=Listeria booriae TaxID=1552123 RepID=UPI00051D03A7|nr:Rha family transcriptional regulator [Listeria booriae]KGL37412.1 antirepressor [Listeriaceae bacterium FSL A5-0209]MBC1231534.1 Rha family transcriptional regulator [Listeria booriae]MBC1801079.1 Rha family transcriptional regulator [Listeria booriae]